MQTILMPRLSFLLRLTIFAELLAIAGFLTWRLNRPRAPLPPFERIDAATSAEIVALRRGVWRNTAESWRRLGEGYLAFGFYSESESCYRYASQLDPENVYVQFQWSMALDRMGQTAEAIDHLQKTLELSQNRDQQVTRICWYLIGRNYLRQEKTADAERSFRKAKGSHLAKFQLARILIESGRVERAIPLLDEVLSAFPQAYEPPLLRARAAWLLDHPVAAGHFEYLAEKLDQPLAVDPVREYLTNYRKHVGMYRTLESSRVLEESGELAAASAGYYQALTLEWNPLIVQKLGFVELQLNHPKKAQELMETLIDRDGPSAGALEKLGYALAVQGDERQASKLWQRASGMRPTKELCNNLANFYSRHEKPESAQQYRALELHIMGVTVWRDGELDDARRALNQAVQLAPRQAQSWYYLGHVNRDLHEMAAAREAYRHCLEIDPYHGRARATLALMDEE